MRIYTPRRIRPDSWLHADRFRWFRDGYAYAGTQTRAIEALSEVEPEALYFAVWAIMRGAGLPDPEAVPTPTPEAPHE